MNGTHVLMGLSLAVGVLGGSSRLAEAASTAVPTSEVRVIENGSGEARVLLDFESLEELTGQWVTSAFLRLPLSETPPSSDLFIQVCSVDTDWRGGGATWTTPWEVDGGDLDVGSPYLTLEEGSVEEFVSVNVTDEVRAIVHGERVSYGLALTVPTWKGEGFTSAERESFGSMEGASLVVSTVKTGPIEALQALQRPR